MCRRGGLLGHVPAVQGGHAQGTQLRRDLRGEFTSDLAGVNSMAFQHLHGDLLWTNERFAVPHADMQLLGGDVRLRYGMTPLGTPRPATVTFKADYADLDASGIDPLLRLTDLQAARPCRWQHRPAVAEWAPGPDAPAAAGPPCAPPREPPWPRLRCRSQPIAARLEPLPFDSHSGLPSLPMAVDVHYTFDPAGITFDQGVASDRVDLHPVRRAHGVWRAIGVPLPGHQPRLAGERPVARRRS